MNPQIQNKPILKLKNNQNIQKTNLNLNSIIYKQYLQHYYEKIHDLTINRVNLFVIRRNESRVDCRSFKQGDNFLKILIT